MAEETVSKRGRPVGTRTATVELETLSFKVPVELKARLQAYAKQRRHSISELIREGVEWRIGEGDPLNIRYGTVASGETAYEGNTGNTDTSQLRLMLQQELRAFFAHAEGVMDVIRKAEHATSAVTASSITGNTGITSVDGDIPVASMKAQSAARQTLAVEDTREGMPSYDPARRVLGKLCRGKHKWGNTGQTLLRLPNYTCPVCEAEAKREKRKAKREAQPVAG